MVRVVHVVVGPEQHGVVRHGVGVARAGGDDLVRLSEPELLELDPALVDVVHLPYTDRLFAATAEQSATAFETMVAPWRAAGIAVSVTLHDLPGEGDDELTRRRRVAYTTVVAGARGVVVNSRRELHLLRALSPTARSQRCILLPIDPVPAPVPRPQNGGDVVVLGFVFPDRGYEPTIDALPTGARLVALGRPSAGHDQLPVELASRAASRGCTMITTGFIEDQQLATRLWTAGVPIAPNRRVAASGSINTWIAHGRRPLVPDSPYSREIATNRPGTVTVYDPDDATELASLILRARTDPDLTWITPETAVGPTSHQVATSYRHHFAGCAHEAAISVGEYVVLPGNRWDLLPLDSPDSTRPRRSPAVSVVVPYYDQQDSLDLVLAGLARQTHPASRLQIVVADDGSPRSPDTGAASGLDVQVVRHANDGFRAAAVRNLGATVADGEVLLFIDADTIPGPDYVAELATDPARAPDVLTVGRRRHAEFAGWTPKRLHTWFDGGPGPVELADPGWLTDAYAESGDLLRADHRSYRHIISAVLGLHRDLFAELGGFDERFRGYGGEDWELAHRAWCAGAVFRHVPEAVAWHDGPDWAGRAERGPGAQNEQTLVLSQRLPDPEARGGGTWTRPSIVVRLGYDDPVEVLATARAAFAGDCDAGVWVLADGAQTTTELLADPRIHPGFPPTAVLASAQVVVDLDAPARLTGLRELARAASTAGPLGLPTGRLVPQRAASRAARWADRLGVPQDLLVARLFGGSDRSQPVGTRPVDLAHELKYTFSARDR